MIWVKFDQNLSSLMRKENEIKLFQTQTTNMILVQVTLKKGWNLNSASIKSLNRTKGFSDAMNREYHLSSQISIFFVIDMFWNINLTYVKSPLFIVIVSLYFKTALMQNDIILKRKNYSVLSNRTGYISSAINLFCNMAHM